MITTTVADTLRGKFRLLRGLMHRICALQSGKAAGLFCGGVSSGSRGSCRWSILRFFTPAAYEEILHSLQPIYGLTAGLSNKTIVKLIHQVLDEQKLQAEYLADEYKERYHLADRNFAIPAIHFPQNMQELLAARRRLVF